MKEYDVREAMHITAIYILPDWPTLADQFPPIPLAKQRKDAKYDRQ